VGVVAVIPYSLALQAGTLAQLSLPIPLWLLISIQVAQNAVLLAVATGAGLFLAYRIGLGAPILERFLDREPIGDRLKAILLPSIVLGVVASLVVIGLDALVFGPALRAELGGLTANINASSAKPTPWQGFLASFYGGIDEEILMRLFLLSLLAFLGKWTSKSSGGHPALWVLWTANILVAVVFGLGHLPATANLVPITPLVVVRAIVLNGLAGLVFGYLYFTRGLESAMLSHFSADIVLHVLFAI
jgi:hypothetical protein